MKPEKQKTNRLSAAVDKAASIVSLAEESDECPKCYGSGMEVVEDKGARICSCRQLKANSRQRATARLPKRYDKFHFNNYKPQNESQQIALKLAISLNHDYPAVERGLLFSGGVGLGKTHIAVSILKGLTERGFSCLFYDFGSLLKEIQDSYNSSTKTSELGVLAPVLNAEILVLDELGSSKPTDWVRDTMTFIINSRYNDKKLTIFTTNYPDDRPNDRQEILEDRIGVRLRSRLHEMCHTVFMKGDDFRKKLDRSPVAYKRAL